MLAAYSILILKLLGWSRRRAVDGPGLVVVVVVVRLQFAPHRRDARMLPSPPSHMEQGTKGEKKKEGLLSCHCRVREATRYLPRQQNKRQGPNQHQGSVRIPSFSLLLPHSGVAMIISPDGNVRDGMELGGMKRGLQQSSAAALVPDPMCNGPFPFLSERRLRRRRRERGLSLRTLESQME
ncbi:hypothetical protein K456DRAFT_662835 [Colletotrichum gloeosporioides 23]|nr:hypothetical protein K456DRAFT_662835 [Colletotrichum gloeosporioides 23]